MKLLCIAVGEGILHHPLLFLSAALILNLITWILFGLDKRRARRGGRRIPEATLFTLTFLGGAMGALCGMTRFRHKTKHLSFWIAVPLAFLGETALIAISLTLALLSRSGA